MSDTYPYPPDWSEQSEREQSEREQAEAAGAGR